MDTYPPGKVRPYVYKLVHRMTKEFYFGSRTSKRQNKPSHLDLPEYRSSSDVVAAIGFDHFDWFILEEFENPSAAYWFEQSLIKEHIHNQLCLNKNYVDPDTGKKMFSTLGHRHSIETKAKMSKAKVGKSTGPFSDDRKAKLSASQTGKIHAPETKVKIANKISQTWMIIHPSGQTETITNMNQFCKERGLDHSAMSKVAKGALPQHKGYRCAKL